MKLTFGILFLSFIMLWVVPTTTFVVGTTHSIIKDNKEIKDKDAESPNYVCFVLVFYTTFAKQKLGDSMHSIIKDKKAQPAKQPMAKPSAYCILKYPGYHKSCGTKYVLYNNFLILIIVKKIKTIHRKIIEFCWLNNLVWFMFLMLRCGLILYHNPKPSHL